MIKSRLRVVAERFGVTNGYQFEKFTGFSASMSYSLWQDKWKRVDMKTLNTLCNLFDCTPNDLIEFTKDSEEQ
jgi:DNA-binding Xre family transcriptional regulator